MKFSRLSTIQFTENDFQSKSPLDMPIIPRGEPFTIVELSEGFNITGLTSYPSMPTTLDIINVRTGVRTTITNTIIAPCVFSSKIDPAQAPGIYRAELVIRNTRTVTSAPFRVVAGNDWGCIVGNSIAEPYSDGTPSIFGGQLIKFYQYFRRKDFRLAAVENNTFYDDERGTSFSLQNKNHQRYHLEGYAGERTIAAISMLLAGQWSMLYYHDNSGHRIYYRLAKSGDISTEVVGRGFCQFSGDFNGRPQNSININWEDAAELLGIEFGTNKNLIIRNYNSLAKYRIPVSCFCQPFTNIVIEKKNGGIFAFNAVAHFQDITFTSGEIPDNFGRSLKKLWVEAIRQGDKVTRIGDNVNLSTGNVQIAADFPSLHTIGKNVTLGDFDGSLRFSNNAVFDNLQIKAATPPQIFCKNAIFKNCKLKDYNIVGDVAELHNVEIENTDFNSSKVRPDALLVGCKFKYVVGPYKFDAQRLINCRMVGTYDASTILNMVGYSGSLVNSFTYQRLHISTDASTSSFTLDSSSLHGYISDTGNYLASIQRQDGRNIDNAGFSAVRYTAIGGGLVYDYQKSSDTMLRMDGSMATRGTPTYIAIGDATPNDLLSDITFGTTMTITAKGDMGGSNLNSVTATGSTVIVAATKLLEWLQSGGHYLNNVDFTLQVDNDLPSGFSYLLFKTNPNVLQNLTLTVNVSNDLTGELTARLRELYPNFTINQI